MSSNNFNKTRKACYSSYFTMSSVFSLPPMLFITFHQSYGISYTLLGTLVLVNFCTQFIVDLIFTFFSKHFPIKKTLTVMPLLTALGFIIYTFAPNIFGENVYLGFLIGTIIFSVAAGLSEVLLSPVIAAIPGSTDKDMSALHSLYAGGVIFVIGVSTVFFKLFGNENWQILSFMWALAPLVTCVLFAMSPIPDMNTSHKDSAEKNNSKKFGLILCVACIFMGAAAENTMTNWISSYMENALGISKTVGDILGMAVFAVLLGLGRILYTKYGKNIFRVLIVSMLGSVACYLIAGLSTNVIISFFACILTGLCTSMLWPGSLIFMEEKVSGAGVAAYALMAAGGDFGSSIAPQLMGAIVDKVSISSWALNTSVSLGIPTEQLSMKIGMLVTALFPIAGVIILIISKKYFTDKKANIS